MCLSEEENICRHEIQTLTCAVARSLYNKPACWSTLNAFNSGQVGRLQRDSCAWSR